MRRNRIKVVEILIKDKYFFYFGFGVLGFWLLFLVAFGAVKIFGIFPSETKNFTEKDIPLLFFINCVATLVVIFCILFRLLYFLILSRKHIAIKGIIGSVFCDNHGITNINFNYEHLGQVYGMTHKMMTDVNKLPSYVVSGAEITVLINPRRPKRYIIADLYTSSQNSV